MKNFVWGDNDLNLYFENYYIQPKNNSLPRRVSTGCVPPACADRNFFNSYRGGGGGVILKGTNLNRSQVVARRFHYQGRVRIRAGGAPMSDVRKQGGCTVRSNASWVMVTWSLLLVDRMTD